MIKESTEIDADLHSKLIFNKNAKANSLQQKIEEQLNVIWKKNCFDPYIIPYKILIHGV